MTLVDDLTQFGLTRQESTMYLALQARGELTGYEAAKLTGISRSNAYNALAALVEKGAAYVMESAVTKYTPVSFEEFSGNRARRLAELRERIVANLPARKAETEGYITISGETHILDKARNMLAAAEYRVYASVSSGLLAKVESDLRALAKRGVKVVVLTDAAVSIDGAIAYEKGQVEGQLRLIVDSSIVLTGQIAEVDGATCLYSKNRNLVDVFKEMLQNEITLLTLAGAHAPADGKGARADAHTGGTTCAS